jgi:hypothetical protein
MDKQADSTPIQIILISCLCKSVWRHNIKNRIKDDIYIYTELTLGKNLKNNQLRISKNRITN